MGYRLLRMSGLLLAGVLVVGISQGRAAWPFSKPKERPAAPAPTPPPNSVSAAASSPALQPQPAVPAPAPGRTLHFTLTSDKQEELFVKLVERRSRREGELKVLDDLNREKVKELDLLNRRLLEMFGIRQDEIYSFVDDENIIYRMNRSAEGEEPASIHHRELKSNDQKTLFKRMVEAKRLVRLQIEVLNLLSKEKTRERGKVLTILEERYKLDPESVYEYTPGTMSIYRVL